MKFLKGLALSLLGFLLFLSLSIFGLAFMLNSTVLNPKFVTSEIDRLDISSLAEEVLSKQTPQDASSEKLKTAFVNTLTEIEPQLKDRIGAGTYSIYDYLLGKSPNIDLALTLRNSILSRDIVVSVVDKVDTSSLAKEFLTTQLTGKLPAEIKKYLDESLDKTLTELKPWIKQQVSAAADPVLDYVVGKSKSLKVVVSLEPVKETLRNNIRAAFLKSPPPELAQMPQATLSQYFDQFYQQYSVVIPATIEINESLLGADMPAKTTAALAEAKIGLEQARLYIGYFQLLYKALIGLMLLLVLGIILINCQVKATSRGLGTTFLTYGALEYAGILVTKYFVGRQPTLPDIPPSLQTWMTQFMDNLLAPLEMLSLYLLIGGIILIVASFIYKPRQVSTPTA